jgi:hypothetical protein
MKSILLSFLILTVSAACAQEAPVIPKLPPVVVPLPEPPSITAPPSAFPVSRPAVEEEPLHNVRKIFLGVNLRFGQWEDLTADPFHPREPKGQFKKKLAKELAGTCLEITDNFSKADAVLAMDYERLVDDRSGIVTCSSDLWSTTCTGGGMQTTVHASPLGGYSITSPIIIEQLTLHDPKTGRKIGNWSLLTDRVKPSKFDKKMERNLRRTEQNLAHELLRAVGCWSDVR